jgi:hypothetical protein
VLMGGVRWSRGACGAGGWRTSPMPCFFASPLSDWITGQVLSVSGGQTMV